ncbi:AMP-binding protein [Actinocorallia sp. A-T 12471]|uniref:AMP-binding protein n=1 Tax=Actinocorallia sp. A-T 12471 TaxID=3089813 RepID=UPI0029D0A09B|nr:AMP-binding protein [Actinocorallia sp. A-T 12471]MDX6739705.1 AMP-binding protein [Actinocorallia sp. A-T 12471]
MAHARPAYRPGLRRRLGHALDYLHVLASGALRLSRPVAALRGIGELQTWGTTLAGLAKAAAAMQPRKTAVLDDTGSLTFAELDERTDRLGAALPLAGPRPRVAILCRNHRGLVEILVACAKRGAETVLLNTGFGIGQLRSVLEELRPAVVVADAEFAPLLRGCPPALVPVVVWAGPEARGETLDALIERAPRGGPALPPPTDGRTIMLSSGTSGRPKGARRRPRPGLGPLASMLSRLPLRSRHTFLIDAPVFHTWGLAALQIGLALRATIVLHRRFDPSLTLGEIERHSRVAHFAVPVMLQRIMELPESVLDGYDKRNLRLAALSGSSLPGDLAHRFMDVFGDRLYNVYGSTEASWVSVAGPKELRINPATAGRPPSGTSVRILDAEGKPVPRATIGRVFAANENVFEGYTGGDPTEVRDGLLATGDLGHLDSHGLLYVDGREDGMVVSGGENVVPRDVEDVLARLPEVREVAVTGVTDPEYGQRLAAYLVLRPGAELTEREVREHVRTRVARFAVPRDVVFVEELPRNATGKVVYRWLDGLGAGRNRTQEGRVRFWGDALAAAPVEGADLGRAVADGLE